MLTFEGGSVHAHWSRKLIDQLLHEHRIDQMLLLLRSLKMADEILHC